MSELLRTIDSHEESKAESPWDSLQEEPTGADINGEAVEPAIDNAPTGEHIPEQIDEVVTKDKPTVVEEITQYREGLKTAMEEITQSREKLKKEDDDLAEQFQGLQPKNINEIATRDELDMMGKINKRRSELRKEDSRLAERFRRLEWDFNTIVTRERKRRSAA